MGVSTPEESKMMKGKVLFLLLVLAACALATQTLASAKALAKANAQARINNQELREAMEEAGDTDSALDWTNKQLRNWGGHYKKILKGMPPLKLKDNGLSLAGSTDLMGSTVSESTLASSKELQILAMTENRLEAAKEDVHEAQTAKSAVKRAQLEDLAEELTHEAVTRLEDTKDA